MKLHAFHGGWLETKKHHITYGRGLNEPYTIPVPFFLIEHPRGLVLFDTGMSERVINDAKDHWGDVVSVYNPVMTKADTVSARLAEVGVTPDQIAWVVLSHLHLDHTGAIGQFPNATHVVQRNELEWAFAPDFYQKAAYIRADFDRNVKWMLLNGESNDDFDLFGDGSIRIWFTPGHSPGHQSLVVNLPNSGPVVLTADACYTNEILDQDVMPGLVWSPPACVRSIARFRHARANWGMTIVVGHDPKAWEEIKKFPDCYE